jgi:lipopolysaccharide biosynthesis glycosyltransferase
MVQSVQKTASLLFAAGVLVHVSFFKSIHDQIVCNGPNCGARIRGAETDAPRIQDSKHDDDNDKYMYAMKPFNKRLDSLLVNSANLASVAAESFAVAEKNSPAHQRANSKLKHEYEEEEMIHLKQQQEPIHLVYASDDASISGVVQSIKSVMHYASSPVVFHFVGDSPLPLPSLPNIMFYNMTHINKQFQLKDFTNPRKRAEKDRKTLNSSLANYVRFVMDSLLPQASKAMWVDADTVFKCDVVPMIRNAFEESNYAVAAVAHHGRPQGLARRIKKDYAYIKHSFNAGVFVADLRRWRQQGLSSKIRNITLSNRKKNIYKYGSQPPLTLVIGNDFEHLHPSWNVKVPQINRYFKEHGNDADICLLHWVGGSKPWEGHGQFQNWWKNYDLHVNRTTMVEAVEKNRAEKARKWKAKVALNREKRLIMTGNEQVD